MTKPIEHDYSRWTHQRWEMCCEEREGFNEETISLELFRIKYKYYLHQEYVKEKEKERADI